MRTLKKQIIVTAIILIVVGISIAFSGNLKGMINPINTLHCSEIWNIQYRGTLDGPVIIVCNIGGVYKCPYCNH